MILISNTALRLKEALTIRDMKQSELVKKTGIGKSSISTYLTGEYKPKQDKLMNLAKALNVSEAWLMGYDVPMERDIHINNNVINIKENNLLNNFRKLNIHGKDKLIERSEELTQIPKYTLNNVEEELSITAENNIVDSQDIKIYDTPVSAGKGSFINDYEPFDIIKVNLKTCPQARRCDFALKVRGDSMEPYYYDGDIVFVKEQPSLDNGQIGIFIYEDEAYIKKYSVQEDGVYLISLNKIYPPIKIDENNTFKICGLVLTV